MKKLLFICLALMMLLSLGCRLAPGSREVDKKPVIYLYTEEPMDVEVKLDYVGELFCSYPEYQDGWKVVAHPDGRLVTEDGKEYSYLFWEGFSNRTYSMDKGFVVKGEDTAEFLEETLTAMGLNLRERNECIVFWLPQMEQNPYNLISFVDDEYKEDAKLEITPTPDSILRVFMVYRPLEKPVEVEEQTIQPFERKGFTVVEWGGREQRER
ncbi:MAG: hypothetical protein Q4Q17_00245 [Tissierellia bacterium]|nr:hypothetical protein [Tissierellia bacterium]